MTTAVSILVPNQEHHTFLLLKMMTLTIVLYNKTTTSKMMMLILNEMSRQVLVNVGMNHMNPMMTQVFLLLYVALI